MNRRRAAQGSALLSLLLCMTPGQVRADCQVLRESNDDAQALTKHLSGDCTADDRAAEAVTAKQIFEALKEGKGIDLVGVLVTGDLNLNALPPVAAEGLAADASLLREALADDLSGPTRLIAGQVSVQRSHVRGEITTNLEEGRLIVTGPVRMEATTFERIVDFTRTVFLEPVDFSGAAFGGEAYFVRARFLREARFEHASFGIRARFHRSRFMDRAVFEGAVFNGMTEFLEARFDQAARFAGARFRLGTGFSGSRFGGEVDLSDALFEREAFFLYTTFEGDAHFRGATFRGFADFSHARFRAADDFSTALFEKEPRFADTTTAGDRPPPGGLHDPAFLLLYGAAAMLFAATVVLAWRLRRRQREKA